MKVRLAAVWAIVQFTVLPSVGLCTDYSFISVDVPGADHTYAYGINDRGQIVYSCQRDPLAIRAIRGYP